MKIVIAPASFKGSLSPAQAAQAMRAGILDAFPDAEILLLPVADGGEGTTAILTEGLGGITRSVPVCGPLGDSVAAEFGIAGAHRLGLIEMAAASGLTLIAPEKRNPLLTTTYGTGQLIRQAVKAGCREILIGIGGSATNDGGAGMAQALDVRFLRPDGAPITQPLTGQTIAEVAAVDLTTLWAPLKDCRITVASDVTNPLLGENGATRIYGPQKGATPAMVTILENNLRRLYDIIEKTIGRRVRDIPGAGAAGGLGAGLLAFLSVQIQPGIDLVLQTIRFTEQIRGADLIITGEGRLDRQTRHGKAVQGILKAAREADVPVIAIAGAVELSAQEDSMDGLSAVYSLTDEQTPAQEAMRSAAHLLRQKTTIAIRRFSPDNPLM